MVDIFTAVWLAEVETSGSNTFYLLIPIIAALTFYGIQLQRYRNFHSTHTFEQESIIKLQTEKINDVFIDFESKTTRAKVKDCNTLTFRDHRKRLKRTTVR